MIDIEKTAVSAVMKLPGLTTGAKLVYASAMYEPHRSLKAIGQDLGKDRSCVSRYSRELRQTGLAELRRTREGYTTLEAKDLCLDGMLAKIGDRLPLRPYNEKGPLIRTLERLGRQYRASLGAETPVTSR